MDFLFHFSAISVVPFWILMIFFPHWRRTQQIVKSLWIVIAPTICYLLVLLPGIQESTQIFAHPSPENLAKLTGTAAGATLFWAYAGAFDLFVGRWIYFDARELKISSWFVSPCLFVCIFFGPLGFFMYAIVRLTYYFAKRENFQFSKNQ